ncbi:hypothetical protein [Clostridium polynesiense]|uniref:hypothetical protein n=1 Tax=Clostridium polynesiense TaxID=1325933 RepID=UPI00059035C6|nr:hypothetical protein [Clostridium polynesiense]
MKKDEKKPYLPDEREQMEADPKTIKSYSPSGEDYTELPDPVRDPIVSNNIANQEFDYTDNEMYKNNDL